MALLGIGKGVWLYWELGRECGFTGNWEGSVALLGVGK